MIPALFSSFFRIFMKKMDRECSIIRLVFYNTTHKRYRPRNDCRIQTEKRLLDENDVTEREALYDRRPEFLGS